MSIASWPLQVAILAALKPALAPVSVYDGPPDGAAFPYVVIGEDVATDWSAVATPGEEIDATIHVWSRYAGSKEVKELMATINRALHGKRLPMDGHRSTHIRFLSETSFTELDEKTRHGVIRFRVRLRRA